MNIITNLLEGESNNIGSLIIMIVLVVAIVALFVWQSISNKKKRQKAEETVGKLKIGDRVKTIGGVCGFVAEINNQENTFVLETGMEGKKSFVKFDKAAIYQTAPANAVVNEPKAEEKTEEVKEEVKEETKEEKAKKDDTRETSVEI